MTSISFTSGEVLDIMSALHFKLKDAELTKDYHLANYYLHLIQQFEMIHDKLQDFVPENRVAHLVLAAS